LIKRFFDIIFAATGLLLLLPIFIIIAIFIKSDSRGPIFYRQKRVGKNGVEFFIWKFRTMYTDSDKKGLLTVGGKDPRITRAGYHLRKYKMDELPQLFNVLTGEMSLVGPRPEVKKYTDLYDPLQRQVLSVRPGITDRASIKYSKENEILAQYEDPEKAYVEKVMPEKLELNLQYVKEQSFRKDVIILWKTIQKIFTGH